MRAEVAADLSDSAAAFAETVWPVIGIRFFGAGELIPVETDTGILARRWDALAGIDAWQVRDGSGMRGIASRVQRARRSNPFNTFTVRKQRFSGALTEYEKRRRAIDNPAGWLYPEFAVQAFVEARADEPMRGRPLLSAAAARTRDIMQCIEDGLATENKTSNASFYVLPWLSVRRAGYGVHIWPQPAELWPS